MIQIYYFTGCCGNVTSFGITSGSTSSWSNFTATPGSVYGLIIDSFSGCVTYSGSSIEPLPLPLLNNPPPIFLVYDNCQFCVENVFPCNTTPTPPPPPTIVGYKNECGIITILPMGVECAISNPSSSQFSDGEVSVSITGGTPPYTTTWVDGPISPAFGGLPNGSYTATTVDYWGDYSATTVCKLYTAPDCDFNVIIVEQDVNNCLPTSMSGYTFDLT